MTILEILQKDQLSHADLVYCLNAEGADFQTLLDSAAVVKEQHIGNKVYLRGLIELSNQCAKNCYYCGIRSGNTNVERYFVSEKETMQSVQYAIDHHFGSIVLQSGERTGKDFTQKITHLLHKIKEFSHEKLGITLSMGEQSEETYQQWFDAGAHRYLLRIETANRELYYKIHPHNKHHDYDNRLNCLQLLRKIGYNVGTGVMIGLPFQTMDHLALDLKFFQDFDIDMCGMGPYIEHENTPLWQFREQLLPLQTRFELALKMIALLRIVMRDVNIAASTAMQTLDEHGREKALRAGANIVMPNLTPVQYRERYLLYKNKPGTDEQAEETHKKFEHQVHLAGCQIGYGEWGDSLHFKNKEIH